MITLQITGNSTQGYFNNTFLRIPADYITAISQAMKEEGMALVFTHSEDKGTFAFFHTASIASISTYKNEFPGAGEYDTVEIIDNQKAASFLDASDFADRVKEVLAETLAGLQEETKIPEEE